MLRPVLEALRNGDRHALKRYEDVYPVALKDYLKESQPPQVEGHITSVPDIALALQEASIAQEGEEDSPKKPANRIRRNDKAAGTARGVLPKVLARVKACDEGKTIYDALRADGHIRAGNEFLIDQG